MKTDPWAMADVMLALLRHIQWGAGLLFPEAQFGGGRCDLLFITRSGYATEYEIKVTAADWKRDAAKWKWKSSERESVARFFYVVPVDLLESPPEILPAGCGVISVSRSTRGGFPIAREVTPARRFTSKPVPVETRNWLLACALSRYWSSKSVELHYARSRSADKRRMRAAQLGKAA